MSFLRLSYAFIETSGYRKITFFFLFFLEFFKIFFIFLFFKIFLNFFKFFLILFYFFESWVYIFRYLIYIYISNSRVNRTEQKEQRKQQVVGILKK